MYRVNHVEGREIPLHSSSLFTWPKGAGYGATFASDLPRPMAAYAYNDAYDIGFAIVSEKTGRKLAFTLVGEEREERNGKSEVLYWTFRSMEEPDVFIYVYND